MSPTTSRQTTQPEISTNQIICSTASGQPFESSSIPSGALFETVNTLSSSNYLFIIVVLFIV